MTNLFEKTEAGKKTPETESKVSEMVRDFFRNMRNMTPKERIKTIGKILFAAAVGRYLPRPLTDRKKKEGEQDDVDREAKAEDEGKLPDIDPQLVGDIPEGAEPVCRRTFQITEMAKDHQHNAGLLEINPAKLPELNKVLEKYKENKARYDKVAQATGIPGMLICALHYREGFDFNRYLHNGERLGKPTTYVPAGILFKEGDWEKAAIHALGGDVVDEHGKPSFKTFQNLRQQLGLNANSTDMGAMMAFAESYNGLGYRSHGVRSCYVYAGTNLNQAGRYVADHKFDPKSVDQRLGAAAIMMGIQQMEAGQSLRVAGQKKDQTSKPA